MNCDYVFNFIFIFRLVIVLAAAKVLENKLGKISVVGFREGVVVVGVRKRAVEYASGGFVCGNKAGEVGEVGEDGGCGGIVGDGGEIRRVEVGEGVRGVGGSMRLGLPDGGGGAPSTGRRRARNRHLCGVMSSGLRREARICEKGSKDMGNFELEHEKVDGGS